MIALEDTYFSMAEKSDHNCLVICDRGLMDASAFITRQEWESLLEKLDLTEESICEGRYNQVLHMVGSLTDVDVIWHYKFACFRCPQRMEPRTFTALRTTLLVSKVWSWLASGTVGPWRPGPSIPTEISLTTEMTLKTR